MIDSNSQKQPKANIVVAPKSSPAKCDDAEHCPVTRQDKRAGL